eukprot:TRINITY_DN5295_c0_g2_i4.p1 TRINITY_DN5295_c0_g2~~TRINITY_DN5295_c0_g2_i4.p1  ORF type:complete len:129 (-),score=7.49 TRINITY_DN5295_c0_g2_i4:635-1021(-)
MLPFGVYVSNVKPGLTLTDMGTQTFNHDFLKTVTEENKSEAERLYGQYYSTENQRYIQSEVGMFLQTPNETSEVIYHAISSDSPKPEYLVGTIGRIIKILRLLPRWVSDIYFGRKLWPGPLVDPKKFQ